MKKNKEIGKLSQKGRPQILTNLEKSINFKDSIEIFNDWKKLTESENDSITPTEKVGIYTLVFSLLEDRIETFWWNCSYVHQWKVYSEWDEDNQKWSTKGKYGKFPNKFQWKTRDIPKEIRNTGNFRGDLFSYNKIDHKLHERILHSEWDRRELIHRNMYFNQDLMDKHIFEVIDLFRKVDKLLQKHKKGYPNLLT